MVLNSLSRLALDRDNLTKAFVVPGWQDPLAELDAGEAVVLGKGHVIRGELALAAIGEAADFDPANPDERFERGRVYIDQGEYEAAIAEYDVVLGLQPYNGPAYYNRGLAYENLDRFAEAILDYTADISLRPDNLDTYFRRARSSTQAKDFAAAVADYTFVIDRQVLNVPALRGRGYASFCVGDFAMTEGDFGVAVRDTTLSPASRVFAALWSYLGTVRQGGEGAAALRATLDTVAEDYNRLGPEPVDLFADVWPGPVAALYLGLLDPDDLLANAVDTETQTRNERLVEISFYLGEFYLAQGDAAAARAQFERALATGVTNYVEYDGAAAELVRLGG